MQNHRTIVFVERLNELSSQLAELEELRLKVEEAERLACAVHTSRSPGPLTTRWKHKCAPDAAT